jgi:hypothetical protein
MPSPASGIAPGGGDRYEALEKWPTIRSEQATQGWNDEASSGSKSRCPGSSSPPRTVRGRVNVGACIVPYPILLDDTISLVVAVSDLAQLHSEL